MVIEVVENMEDTHREAVLYVLIKEVLGGLAKLLLVLVHPVEAMKARFFTATSQSLELELVSLSKVCW